MTDANVNPNGGVQAQAPTNGQPKESRKGKHDPDSAGVQIPKDAIKDLRRIKAHLELKTGDSYNLGAAAGYAFKKALESLGA